MVEESEHSTYELAKEVKATAFAFLCFITYWVLPFGRSEQSFENYFLFIVGWGFFLFYTYKIELIDDRYLIFHQVIKTTKIEIHDITRGIDGIRFYRLCHKKGFVFLDQQISDLDSFKCRIKRLCPGINQEEITGENLHKDIFGIGLLLELLSYGILAMALIVFLGFKYFNL